VLLSELMVTTLVLTKIEERHCEGFTSCLEGDDENW
jgi:hypothetical protein